MKKIIVPVNFTKAADTAIKQAITIAAKTRAGITLLHIVDDRSPSKEVSENILKEKSIKILQEHGLQCDYLLRAGNAVDTIAAEQYEDIYELMVIGTHGIKGLRQKLFGADILKLVSKIPVPVLVVQEDSPHITAFNKIVLPVSSHEVFNSAINAVLLLAEVYNTEIHLYSVIKPGFEWPAQMKKNIDNALDIFKSKGIKVIRIKEDQNVYSYGYTKQILNYASSVQADGICMISLTSDEYYYFAQTDKETLIENEPAIPILCSGGGV